MSGHAILAHLLLDRLCARPAPRVPEPEGVMLDAQQNTAFTQAGREHGVLAFLYAYHALHIAAQIAPGAQVLDLACGPANQLAQAARLVPEARFIGLDASERMLAEAQNTLAREGIGNAQLVAGDITDLAQWKDASVDCITCTMSLHHLEDTTALARALRAARRVLKPGGGVYLADFGRLRSFRSQRYFAQDWHQEQTPEFTLDYLNSLRAAFDVAELSAAVRGAGLDLERHVTPLGPFLVVFRGRTRTHWSAQRTQRAQQMHARLSASQKRKFHVLARWLGAAGCTLPLRLA